MSAGGGLAPRSDQVQGAARYDPVCDQRYNEPPPLPADSPVGPAFDPSGSEESYSGIELKPVHRFIPDSWKNFFRGSRGSRKPWSLPASDNNHTNSSSEGKICSPPHSLPSSSIPGSSTSPDQNGAPGLGHTFRKEHEANLLVASPSDSMDERATIAYRERLESYRRRHSNMRSWPGLLRVLGCVELLLGAAVFACVCSYLHKDNEWYSMFGYSQSQSQTYGGGYGTGYVGGYGGMGYPGGGAGGVYYSGPKTIFVLVVAGLAWLTTVVLLVLGMTTYYRTILLASGWWPITEFVINLVLAVLYMAAGIAYVRDTTRGGLCYYPMFNNGLSGNFCRTESGQTAAIAFLFITMVVYVISAILCIKVWRHEIARRYKEDLAEEMKTTEVSAPRSMPVKNVVSSKGPEMFQAVPMATQPAYRQMPKTLIMPDYVTKYPSIRTDEERDRYRAVFKDQYAEYKELHAEVQATMKKFDEMDVLMSNLPQHPANQAERNRINMILQEYQRKKKDPAFLEKKERCEYLKNKLSHIKLKIQEYNKAMNWTDGYS